MSGAPVVRVTVASPVPVIRVAAPTMPAVVRVQSLGAQGPAGPAGGQGVQGIPGDYGYIRYGEMVGATPRQIPANTVVPFAVQPPVQTIDALKPPFVGFAFMDAAGVLRARKSGDSYLLTVQFSATPALINGYVRVDINVAGNISGLTGPIRSGTYPLTGAAGSTTQVGLTVELHPQSGFIANGATITLFASVPISVSSDLLYIDPQVAAP